MGRQLGDLPPPVHVIVDVVGLEVQVVLRAWVWCGAHVSDHMLRMHCSQGA